MNIQITNANLTKFIDDKVKSGEFSSPGEVIEAGLARLMLDSGADTLDADDVDALTESEMQIDRGQDRDWTEVSAELRRQYLAE